MTCPACGDWITTENYAREDQVTGGQDWLYRCVACGHHWMKHVDVITVEDALKPVPLKDDLAGGSRTAPTNEMCEHCGATIEEMEQMERSVYARPCRCSLWQGDRVPEAWRDR